MIRVACIVCGEDFSIEVDEYLEDEEFFCPDCASAAFEWCIDEQINPN